MAQVRQRSWRAASLGPWCLRAGMLTDSQMLRYSSVYKCFVYLYTCMHIIFLPYSFHLLSKRRQSVMFTIVNTPKPQRGSLLQRGLKRRKEACKSPTVSSRALQPAMSAANSRSPLSLRKCPRNKSPKKVQTAWPSPGVCCDPEPGFTWAGSLSEQC